MTIYVDRTLTHHRVNPKAKHHGKQWCHMATDSDDIEELHRFAESIGLKREWFQNDDPRMPHYDLTPPMQAKAIVAGAKYVSEMELLIRCHSKYKRLSAEERERMVSRLSSKSKGSPTRTG